MRDALPDYIQTAIDSGSIREVCPRCDGGSTRESCLSIRYSEDAVTTFKCFRSTCGWFGMTAMDNRARVETKKLKVGRVYRNPTIPLQGNYVSILRDRYQLRRASADGHGWRISEHGEELVMPVLDRYGRERGHVTRTFETPKRCYTYKATVQPWLDWWFDDLNSAPVVVVEDCLSACRLHGLGYNACTLLGTSMSTEQAREIADTAGDRAVHLALDRDAFDKAMKLRDRHAHVLRIDTVACLTVDIKNIEHDDDILKLFGDTDGRDTTLRSSVQGPEGL